MKNKNEFNFPISHPEKILYPKENITKLDLAKYYYDIQKWILPYIAKRPLSIVRCPQGQQHTCFFQKHINESSSGHIYTVDIKEKLGVNPGIYIKDIAGLITLAQLNTLEIHPWGCRIDNIEKPDMITIDLDPSPEVDWKQVIEAAFFIKDNLQKLDLISFVKTTGGKGLHVVIPFKRQYDWPKVEIFAKTFVDYLVSLKPEDYLATMSKAKRKDKIFIDYLRNKRGATAVAAYSTRVKDNATISTPLSWDELTPKIKNDKFTITTIPKRLEKLKKDPWEGFFDLKQRLKLP